MNSAIERAAKSDTVELRVPCSPQWVALARLAAAAVANRLKFSIEEIEDVKLAVAEACTAVIQHDRHGEYIELICEVRGEALGIHIRDAGRHIATESPPPIDLDDARVAGLGIFLIRTLMDELSYEVDPESGTDLRMTKKPAGR